MSPQPLFELLSLFWVYSLKAESCKTRIPPGVTKHLDPLWGFKFFIYLFFSDHSCRFCPPGSFGQAAAPGRTVLPPPAAGQAPPERPMLQPDLLGTGAHCSPELLPRSFPLPRGL